MRGESFGHRGGHSASGVAIRVLAAWMALSQSALVAMMIATPKPAIHAVGMMAGGLLLFWNILGGLLIWRFRDSVGRFVIRLPGPWQLKFVLFCTALALLEEVITTTMTNLAPVFGVPIGRAYITASANYLDVVTLHSVVAFVPMFACWAWMLKRWRFTPNAVFLLFGTTGVLAELSFGGILAIISFGSWMFVYGLMVYLPAYSVPIRESAKPPGPWMYPLAVGLPIICAIPVALVVMHFHPYTVHFPKMQG